MNEEIIRMIENLELSNEELVSMLLEHKQPKTQMFKFVAGGSNYVVKFNKQQLQNMLDQLELHNYYEIGTNIDLV